MQNISITRTRMKGATFGTFEVVKGVLIGLEDRSWVFQDRSSLEKAAAEKLEDRSSITQDRSSLQKICCREA